MLLFVSFDDKSRNAKKRIFLWCGARPELQWPIYQEIYCFWLCKQ